MDESSVILVDSNVLIDIFQNDRTWATWSLDQLARYNNTVINPIIYAELCYQNTSSDELDQILAQLDIKYSEISRDALYLASQAFRLYRQRGGLKTSPLPDFFIGAHATSLGISILTRDTDRYRTYFPRVELIHP
jgi:predicted nucleic acid-binding protein